MVSVIVPVYNVADYLGQCIESICRQTYRELEIILVDDGSTDNCPEICDGYAHRDQRIKVIHKENGGLASARKEGLALAQGEYVVCVDSDDWVEPDMLERLLAVGYNADVIAFAGYVEYKGYQEVKKNTVEEGLYSTRNDLENLYSRMLTNENYFEHGILASIWSKLFKRSVLYQHQMNVPDIVSYGEDAACVYPCILSSQSVYVTNMLLYHYRVRPGSIVREAKVSNENFSFLYYTLKEEFDRHMQKNILRQQLKHYMWQALLLKGYDRIKSSMVLFPFKKVSSGMRLAIYGAGLFGQVVEKQCRESAELKVVGWYDRKHDAYSEQGLTVMPGNDALDGKFDLMVIAILNVNVARGIKEDFVGKGMREDKIDYVSTEIIEQSTFPYFIQNLMKEENNV